MRHELSIEDFAEGDATPGDKEYSKLNFLGGATYSQYTRLSRTGRFSESPYSPNSTRSPCRLGSKQQVRSAWKRATVTKKWTDSAVDRLEVPVEQGLVTLCRTRSDSVA